MVVPPTLLTASELRATLRRVRIEVSKANEGFRPASDPRLNAVLESARSVGSYMPIKGEPDPAIILQTIRNERSLPHVARDGVSMSFRHIDDATALEDTHWGGQQPSCATGIVIPDAILVPLLGFDEDLNRLGQGGGHYDRYLAAHPQSCRIGIAWEAQKVAALKTEPWDIPMDAVITERHVYIKDLSRCRCP